MEAAHRNGQIVTFYSFKGGVGRTMAMANIAWLLASTGRRVLTVDWDLESPGLHRYFAPFLPDRDLSHSPGVIDAIRRFSDAATIARDSLNDVISDQEIRRLAQVRQFVTSLERFDFPDDGGIDFMSPGRQTAEYSRIVSTFSWDDFYERLNGEAFLLALAEDMRHNYDIALIDSRTGLSDNAGICTITLPDTVVNCFTFNNQSIEGAAAVARDIRSDPNRAREIRVFPVPTRVEDGETDKLDRRRSLAQQRFSEYLSALHYSDPSMYWGSVEIPYKTFYAYEETLAAFGDPPHQQTTLLAAYERLAGLLVDEPVRYPGLPEPVRRGWLTEFEQRGSANAGLLLIGYTPRERVFAEWISHQLRLVGQRSALQDLNHTAAATAALADAERAVVVLSSEAALNPVVHTWWHKAVARDVPGQGRFLVPVRIDDTRLPDPFDRREPVDMFNVSENHARDALLSRLGLREAARVVEPVGSGPAPRFPYSPARVWRVPARNNSFVGRDAALETLRERLNSSTAQSGPAVLQGIGGVGKTQIAIEYLHRFAADYDIAWWISADQPALAATAFSDLAREIQLPTVDQADEQVAAVLKALRLGDPSNRWIIVFDNSEEPSQIRRFLPEGRGDVIITTPGQEWSREAWTLDVNVFDRSESISLLGRRVPSLAEPEADAIAAKLGDLPLAVEQAASWLSTTAMSARNYLDLLDEHLPRILNEPPPPGYRHPAAETWRLSQARLRQSNPAAARLAEICAFLAPEPIPTTLLDNSATVAILASVNPQYKDQLLRGSLVREISRYGLARVDPATNAIRMHRLIQSVLRGDLPGHEQGETERHVHEILAAEKRGDPDDKENWPTYQGLLAHLEPSKALESLDPDVHQLTIDMVRYLRYRGDFDGARGLADRAITAWERTIGTESVPVLRMRTELGNVLNARSDDYQGALAVLQDVVDRMSTIDALGEGHPYTLVALGGLAASLRGLGQYQRARDLDEVTVVRWQAAMGDVHTRTLMARNNLALSLRSIGDFSGAFQQDQELVRRYEERHGRDYRWTLDSRINLGRDQRELGDLQRSEDTLRQAVASCRSLGLGGTTTPKAIRNLAITLRQLGRPEESLELIEPALASSVETWGAAHPYTAELRLEEARARSALGDHETARALTDPIVKAYRDKLVKDHPVTLSAINDLALYHLRLGEHAAALSLLEDAAEHLVQKLGADHPNTLVCQMNVASARLAAGDAVAAFQTDEHCHKRLRARFIDTHPAVLAAAANLAISMIATGADDAGRTLQRDTVRRAVDKLGSDHPAVRSMRDGVRVSSHIDPPDV